MPTLSPDVTSRVEAYLCDKMAEVITDVTFLVEDAPENANRAEGKPFGVPLMQEALQVNPPAEVYLCTINFALQTMPDDNDGPFHDDALRRMIAVIQDLKRQGKTYSETHGLLINGLHIVSIRPVLGEQAQTSVIEMRLACQLRTPVT